MRASRMYRYSSGVYTVVVCTKVSKTGSLESVIQPNHHSLKVGIVNIRPGYTTFVREEDECECTQPAGILDYCISIFSIPSQNASRILGFGLIV
jgi:hypothetical protein